MADCLDFVSRDSASAKSTSLGLDLNSESKACAPTVLPDLDIEVHAEVEIAVAFLCVPFLRNQGREERLAKTADSLAVGLEGRLSLLTLLSHALFLGRSWLGVAPFTSPSPRRSAPPAAAQAGSPLPAGRGGSRSDSGSSSPAPESSLGRSRGGPSRWSRSSGPG